MENEALDAHITLGVALIQALELEVPRNQGITLESTRVPTNANSACVMYPKLVASTQQLQTQQRATWSLLWEDQFCPYNL